MTNEEFVIAIEESRALVRSGKYDQCACSHNDCEWHGRCFECVMIHRVKGRHVPECLQLIFRDKITELARTAELSVVDARPSAGHWAFLKAASPRDRD